MLSSKETDYLDADGNNEVSLLLEQALATLKDEAIEKAKALKTATESALPAFKKAYQGNQRLISEINSLKDKAAIGAQYLADRREFIATLDQIKSADVDTKLFNKIKAVTTYLKKDKGCLDEVNYAFVSSMLEAVLIDLDKESTLKNQGINNADAMSNRFRHMPSLKKHAENLFYARQRHQKIIHTIKTLERKAALAVKHLAREKIIDELDAYYKPLFKVGFSRTTTVDASLGLSVGLPVEGVGVKLQTSIIGEIKVQWFLDDEGYIAIVKSGAIGSATEASADFGLASASVSASGELSMGTYYEVKTSREFVTYLLPELIRDRKHRNDPNIAPYFSRSGILANAMKGVSQSSALWAVTRNEVDDIDLFKRDNDLLKDHDDMLLSLNNTKSANSIKSVALQISSVTPGEATLKGNSLKFNANGEAGFDKLGIKNFVSVGGSAEYSRNQRRLRDVTATSICKRLNESDSLIERTEIAQEIKTQYRTFQSTVLRSWGKESLQVELSKIGLEIQKMSFDIKVSDDTFSGYLRANQLNQNLIQLRKNNLSRKQRWDLIKTNNLLEKKATADFSNEQVLFNFLKQDFKFYTDLHIRIAARGYTTPEDQQSLDDFAARYGASTKEQFLHRLVIANAYLFSQSNNDVLKAEMLEFEQAVLSPKFSFDKKYMKEHAYYQEEVNFEVIENTVKGEFKVDVVSLGCTLSLEGTHRERKHINQLRDGDYFDLAFKITVSIKDPAALAEAITQKITSQYPPDLAKIILKDVTSTLEQIEPTASANGERAYLLRYFKPKAFGGHLPYKKLFYRTSNDTEFHLGLQVAAPVFTGINITGGIGYRNSSTDSESERFSSDTFIYALMFGMREYALNINNERTEKITNNAHWLQIKRQQERFFKEAFAKYAQELNTQCAEHGSLTQEMMAISTEFLNSRRISDVEKKQFRDAYDRFKTAVVKFNENEKCYQDALTAFEEFMHGYAPHWLDRRAHSDYIENRHLPKLEESQIELKARIQAEKRKHGLWTLSPAAFVPNFYLMPS